MVPSFTNIQPLILYASKYKKNNTTAKHTHKKNSLIGDLGEGPLDKTKKTKKNNKNKNPKTTSPHGRSYYPHMFFCFNVFGYPPILMVLALLAFLVFVFFCLFVCFLSYLLSPKKNENWDVGAALVHQPSFALCYSFLAMALVPCSIAAAKPKQSPKDDWEYLI